MIGCRIDVIFSAEFDGDDDYEYHENYEEFPGLRHGYWLPILRK